jgi:hypothetical protein
VEGNPYDPESIFSLGNSAITCSEIEVTKKMLLTKGQLILKCLFGVFNFFKKINENMLHSSKNEVIRLFFWKNSWLDNLLLKLTDI